MKCYRCNGTGTIKVGVGTSTNPDGMLWSDRGCWRCYGTGDI